MAGWPSALSRLAGVLIPGPEMANFSMEIEIGRAGRLPFSPTAYRIIWERRPGYRRTSHTSALERRKASRLTYRRYVGNQDLATGEFFLYRGRFILAWDLTGAWADFGWIGSKINHPSTVVARSITDRAGIALTYEYLGQRRSRNWRKCAPIGRITRQCWIRVIKGNMPEFSAISSHWRNR